MKIIAVILFISSILGAIFALDRRDSKREQLKLTAPQSRTRNPPAKDYDKNANDAALVRHASRTAWATIVIAFASTLAFCAAILQYLVFSGQLAEMKSTGGQTDKLIETTEGSPTPLQDRPIQFKILKEHGWHPSTPIFCTPLNRENK